MWKTGDAVMGPIRKAPLLAVTGRQQQEQRGLHEQHAETLESRPADGFWVAHTIWTMSHAATTHHWRIRRASSMHRILLNQQNFSFKTFSSFWLEDLVTFFPHLFLNDMSPSGIIIFSRLLLSLDFMSWCLVSRSFQDTINKLWRWPYFFLRLLMSCHHCRRGGFVYVNISSLFNTHDDSG